MECLRRWTGLRRRTGVRRLPCAGGNADRWAHDPLIKDQPQAPAAMLVPSGLLGPDLALHNALDGFQTREDAEVWLGEMARAVRLPRSDAYAVDLLTEARWLPPYVSAVRPPVSDVSSWPSRRPCSRDRVTREVAVRRDPRRARSGPSVTTGAQPGSLMGNMHDLDTFGLEAAAERWGYRAGEPVNDTIDAWAEESRT